MNIAKIIFNKFLEATNQVSEVIEVARKIKQVQRSTEMEL